MLTLCQALFWVFHTFELVLHKNPLWYVRVPSPFYRLANCEVRTWDNSSKVATFQTVCIPNSTFLIFTWLSYQRRVSVSLFFIPSLTPLSTKKKFDVKFWWAVKASLGFGGRCLTIDEIHMPLAHRFLTLDSVSTGISCYIEVTFKYGQNLMSDSGWFSGPHLDYLRNQVLIVMTHSLEK